MIEELFDEINLSECETQKPKKHLHPTLKQVEKQMKGFDESLVMYMYHHLNGREEEARTYLEEWEEQQQELKESFRLMNELQKLNSPHISDNGNDSGKHATSNPDDNIEK